MAQGVVISPLTGFRLGAALSSVQFSAVSTPVVPGLGGKGIFDLHPQPLGEHAEELHRFHDWLVDAMGPRRVEDALERVLYSVKKQELARVMTVWGKANIRLGIHRKMYVSLPDLSDHASTTQMAFYLGGDRKFSDESTGLFFRSRKDQVAIQQEAFVGGKGAIPARLPEIFGHVIIDVGGRFLERASRELIASGDLRWRGILETLEDGHVTPLSALGIVLFFTQEFAIKGVPRKVDLIVKGGQPEVTTLEVKPNGVVKVPSSLELSELAGSGMTFWMPEASARRRALNWTDHVEVEYIPPGHEIPDSRPYDDLFFTSSPKRRRPPRTIASSPLLQISQRVSGTEEEPHGPFAFAVGDLMAAAAEMYPGLFPLRAE